MDKEEIVKRGADKLDWILSGLLSLLAGILFFASCASYAFPGESAHLMAVWRGLDMAAGNPYPLMAAFARLLGTSNVLAPIMGVIAVFLLYHVVSAFVRMRVVGEKVQFRAKQFGRIAGVTACLVFMLSPAVRSAATHLEPRLFDFTWVLASFALMLAFTYISRKALLLLPVLLGVMTGLAYLDSPLPLALLPLYVLALVLTCLRNDKKPFLALTIFAAFFLITFMIGLSCFDLELAEFLKGSVAALRNYSDPRGWLFVLVFSTVPFIASLFSAPRSFSDKQALASWIFHLAMTFFCVLAIASPLSPSSLMEPYGIMPVATCAFVAFVAGHLVAFWWSRVPQVIGIAAGGLFALVVAITLVWNLFTFDGDRGAFADEAARKIIADLGDRKWFVTDGTLDDHLRLAAEKAGRELNIVALHRDLDEKYLKALADLVREKKICGPKNGEIVLSVSLGVLPFVQDWFEADPTAGDQVAIYGAPDLWYSASVRAVPEFLFFGGDAKRVPDWSAWKTFDKALAVKKGWGSYRDRRVNDPVEQLRNALRRHLGLVANDRGVWLQDEKNDNEAFDMYELVLNEIDTDNVSAMFNELGLVSAKNARAMAKQHEIDKMLQAVVDDKSRRYYVWRLANYYGYIRNPDMFVRTGFAWARSGRPGEALRQIRRAIEFVPTDRRTVLLNMMASLYASENDAANSRKIYSAVLSKNEKDHDALIGMMRLELLDGNSAKALDYLQKAVAAGADATRLTLERAMVAMMKNDLKGAQELLKKVTDKDPKNLQAWSLQAAVAMQMVDAAKDPAEKAKLTKVIEFELLPEMEKNASDVRDYYVQTTKAFLLLRKGEDKENRRAARDAFVAAAHAQPSSAMTHDLVLGLDISLDDKENAEAHARDVLRRNRNAPLANYVMGSIALGRDENDRAEAFLRKAADAPKPVVLAVNDLAEVLRRTKKYAEAERYARKATQLAPKLYVAWETLASILLDAGVKLDEAEACAQKACDLSRLENGRESDVRMLITLARVQMRRGDRLRAKGTVRSVEKREGELSDFERKEFETLKKSVR